MYNSTEKFLKRGYRNMRIKQLGGCLNAINRFGPL